jgi:BlaI family penicillinase repressor
MTPTRRLTLTARELDIMRVVWDRNGATVREVHSALTAERPAAYTTVMTLMRVLEGKGYLTRHRGDDRAYIYTPTHKRQQVLRSMVRDFVDRVFDGATQSLRLHLVKHEALDARERAELRRMIDALDEEG